MLLRFIWCNCFIELVNTLEEVLVIAVPDIFTDPEMKASMVDMTEVKIDVSGTMRTKIKEWASGIGVDYKYRLKIQLISRDPRLCFC
jgi:hypothetical protein